MSTDTKTTKLTVLMSRAEMRALKRLAGAEMMGLSTLVRHLIHRAIEARTKIDTTQLTPP